MNPTTKRGTLGLLAVVCVFLFHAYFFNGAAPIPNSRLDPIYSFVEPETPDTFSFRINRFVKSLTRPATTPEWSATPEGNYYSNQPPGLVVLGVPFYFVLHGFLNSIHFDSWNYSTAYLNSYLLNLWLSVLWSAFACLLLFWLLVDRFLKESRSRLKRVGNAALMDAGIITGIFGLATLQFPFSTQTWGHPTAAAMIVSALYLLHRDSKDRGLIRLAGFLFGMAFLIDHSVAIALGSTAAYLFFSRKKSRNAALADFLVPALPWIAFLLFYQKAHFGGWFTTASSLVNPELRSGGESVLPPLALLKLLFSWNKGLLVFSPILALSIANVARKAASKQWDRFSVYCSATIATYLVYWSFEQSWLQDTTPGLRQMIVALPFFCMLLPRFSQLSTLAQGTAVVLGLASFLNMLVMSSVGFSMELDAQSPFLAQLYQRAALGELFHEFRPFHIYFTAPLTNLSGAFNWGSLLGLQDVFSVAPIFVIIGGILFHFRSQWIDPDAPPLSRMAFMRLASGAQRFAPSFLQACFLLIGIWLFGFVVTLGLGSRQYMPMDQSIVFDAGWRLLSGQIPFRDFGAPSGLVPGLMQAVFFKLFGVSWFSYCLHSAFISGAASLLCFYFLRALGGSWIISVFFALLSSIVFYAPMATPFMDQHGFFFLLGAFCLAVFASNRATPDQFSSLAYLILPLVLALSFLSKPIPALFGIPVVLAFAFGIAPRGNWKNMAVKILAGALASLVLAALLMAAFGMRWESLWLYGLKLPLTSLAKMASMVIRGNRYLSTVSVVEGWGLYSVVWAMLVSLLCLSVWINLTCFRPERRNSGKAPLSELSLILLPMALVLICYFFSLFSMNQYENGIAFGFLAAGLAYSQSQHWVWKMAVFGTPSAKIARRLLRFAMFPFLLMFAFVDAADFQWSVNQTRLVNDTLFSEERAKAAHGVLPPALSYLQWSTPVPEYDATSLAQVTAFFSRNPGNFFLLGDSSLLYAITGRPSVNPALWFHSGVSIPEMNTREFDSYEQAILESMAKHQVRYLVLEGRWTWAKLALMHFPRLEKLALACPAEKLGHFKVIRLECHKPESKGQGAS